MKKFTFAVAMLLTASLSYGYEVSTEVTKKNVVLEEFTGIYCGYCPQAHIIANYMHKARPENLFVIGIHAGSYASPSTGDPDFRTDEGEAICSEFSASSFPIGTLSRHIFAGSSVLTSRSYWVKYAKELYEEDAPVNLHLSSSYDGSTRQLDVTVEGYYTAETQEELQCLTVVITQSDIMGLQSGSGVGDEYMHQHVLRAHLTPTWGDTLATPAYGEYFTKTYNYSVPESINAIDVLPEDIEIIAFVAVDKTEIQNVVGGKPTYTNYSKPLGGTIDEPLIPISGSYGFNFFDVELTSTTDQEITAATFGVTINGNTQVVPWSGSIGSFASQYVTLPVESYLTEETNYSVEIELLTLNGTAVDSSTYSVDFTAPTATTPEMSILFKTDYYADENTFVVKDEDGNVVAEYGPYTTGKTVEYTEYASLEANKTYCAEMADCEGDGVSSGYIKIYNDSEVYSMAQYTIGDFGGRLFFTTSSTPYQVTTEITKKKVVLEEFTGIYCGWCPTAHVIIEDMHRAHHGDFYAVGIHPTSTHTTPTDDSHPDFRTEVGDEIATVYVPDGFPTGVVGRRVFRDNNAVESRSYWIKDAKTIYAEDAPVNLRMSCTYDGDTRELVVNVKGYYTAEVQEELQCLSVLYTQSNIIGYQSSGSTDYSHQHVLREYLTPTWGDTLDTPKQGEFFEKIYTHTLPEAISDLAVMPEDIEIIAFVGADKGEILNATGSRPTYTNYSIELGATIDEPLIPISGRYAYNFFEIELISTTTEEITAATFDVTINGETQVVEWSGSLTAFDSEFISLPVDEYEVLSSNSVTVELVVLNETAIENGSTYSASFSAPVATTDYILAYIKTDIYADENTYTIKDQDGDIEESFGPFEAGTTTEATLGVSLKANQIYCFEITDSEGDGISSGQLKMYNDDSSFVMQQYSLSDFGYRMFFTTTEYTSTMEVAAAELYTYDSSSKTLSLCDGTTPAQISVISIAGATVMQTQESSISLASLARGIYLVKIVQGSQEVVVKLAL